MPRRLLTCWLLGLVHLQARHGGRAKGFGSPRHVRTRAWANKPFPEADLRALEELGTPSIPNYLDPRHDESSLADAGRRLQAGEVVILRDAFRREFAEATYLELQGNAVPWTLNQAADSTGYAYQHHNVYDRSLCAWRHAGRSLPGALLSLKFHPIPACARGTGSARLNATFDVFDAADSRSWIEALTKRNCAGPVVGSPSYYAPGDHSLPHTDWSDQRTVAYVWHLSKAWQPEFGGALYWAQSPHATAFHHASFNTLVLFLVTTESAHFVTTVGAQAKGKRLAFNGWWQSAWLPSGVDDVEALLGDDERRRTVTHAQLQAVSDVLQWYNIPAPGQRERLLARQAELMAELRL